MHAYLDDILVTGTSESEHLQILEQVLTRLEEVGIRLKESKCQFLLPSVEYLGYGPKDLYVAELQTRTKRREEYWASFGDSLRVLSDRAYPDFEDKARERLALNQFLSQIDNPQVAFGVKQKRPGNIDEAVAATMELESYLKASGVGKSHQTNFVAQQQTTSSPRLEETAAMVGATMVDDDLRSTLRVLSERLHRVETSHCEKFRTLISNSWPILQTSVTFPAHASIEMYGVKFIFEYHKSGKVAI